VDPTQRTTLAEMVVPAGLAATAQDLWATDWAAGTVVQILKGGQLLTPPAVVASGLKGPEGLAVAPDGSLLVVEALAGKLSRIILPAGTVSAVAEGLELGAAGPPTMPPVWIFDGVAVGPSGAIYVGGGKANMSRPLPGHFLQSRGRWLRAAGSRRGRWRSWCCGRVLL
jgi:hypothetical protein